MRFLEKVLYFLSVVMLTIILGFIGSLVTKHFVEFFTFDPYIEAIVILACLIIVVPVSVYLLTSRLPFISRLKKDQIQGTEKKEDVKIDEL